jgi:hypothetical protein
VPFGPLAGELGVVPTGPDRDPGAFQRIRIDTSAGHGASAPTSKVIAESADVLAFLRIALRLADSGAPPVRQPRSSA